MLVLVLVLVLVFSVNADISSIDKTYSQTLAYSSNKLANMFNCNIKITLKGIA